jgi:hypothetical protein
VDSTTEQVFAFVGISGPYSETGLSAVYQDNDTLSATYPGVKALCTTCSSGPPAGYYLLPGTFDNVYFQSSSHSGNLYVMGGDLSTTFKGVLYQVGISNGALSSSNIAAAFTGVNNDGDAWSSQVTEFCNPGANSECALNSGQTATTTGTDYIFFSVNSGNKGGCNVNVSTPGTYPTPVGLSVPGTGTSATSAGCWATGGLIIDNSVPAGTQVGASQIYFIGLNGNAAGGPTGTTQASSTCTAGSGNQNAATQASQSSP